MALRPEDIEKNKQILEELDDLEDQEDDTPPTDNEIADDQDDEQDQGDDGDDSDEDYQEDQDSQRDPDDQDDEGQASQKKEVDTYSKRYADSTRENQILNAKNKSIMDRLDKARQITEVSEEELQREFPEWNEMTTTEQRMAKRLYLQEKRFTFIDEAVEQTRQIDAWSDKVQEFLDDDTTTQTYKDLQGREAEFKLFATKPTRVGVPLADVVAAFLYDASKTPVKKHKGSLLATAGGARGGAPKAPNRYTAQDMATLRKENPKKWAQLVKAKKFKVDY